MSSASKSSRRRKKSSLPAQSLAHRLVAAGVDRAVRAKEKTSDHAPVWIELADEKNGT
jgi:exodeoxyribonuclease-3